MLLLLSVARSEARQELSIWSAYSGREEVGLRDAVAAFQRRRPDLDVKLLSIPFGAYLAKLEAAIPTGNGPDLFVDSHERMPELAARDLLEPWPDPTTARAQFVKPHLDALSDHGQLLGLPLALKSLALYVNTALVPEPIVTTARLRQLRATLPVGTYPLVFEAENPYYAAAVLHAFGGSLLSKDGEYAFVGASAERTLETLNDWTRSGTIPEAPSGDLVKRLFATGKAATAISGPWLATDLPATLQFRVEPLPALTEAGGNSLLPFVTIEAAFVTRHTARAQAAFALAAFLAGEEGAQIRAQNGGQVVALPSVRDKIREPREAAFARAAATGIPMPVHPRMHAVWEPAGRALQSALRGGAQAKIALASAAAMFVRNTRAAPAPAKPAWLLVVLGLVMLWGAEKLFGACRNAEFRRGVR
ncbi:MAG TPA: extracellular solute-binding protein, partial [Polyangiaceae bacterium]